MFQFFSDHRLKLILDPSVIDLGPGNDDAGFHFFIWSKVQKLFVFAQSFCLNDLFFFGDQRHNSNGCDAVAFFHRIVVCNRGERNIPNRINCCQQFFIHTEHPSLLGCQHHFPFRRTGPLGTIHRCHGCQTDRTFFFMDLPGIIFPDKDLFLSQI